MKKLFTILFALLLNVGICQSILVKIPDADDLYKRFKLTTFAHFIDNTSIISQLAGKKVEVFEVCVVVDEALEEYKECMKFKEILFGLTDFYFNIIELILLDSPEAIKELNKFTTEIQCEELFPDSI